jgi:hypothetical protein
MIAHVHNVKVTLIKDKVGIIQRPKDEKAIHGHTELKALRNFPGSVIDTKKWRVIVPKSLLLSVSMPVTRIQQCGTCERFNCIIAFTLKRIKGNDSNKSKTLNIVCLLLSTR